MRTLRRILGVPRFEKSELSDYQVRESLGQPSIDYLVLCQRLMYVKRVLARCPRALTAILQSRDAKHDDR